jgi:serine/threonine-protein kinase
LLEPDPTSPGLTTTHQWLGTLSTMAPEQIRCLDIDARTDIYGLGMLLYVLLTGVYPFRGPAEELARQHLETPPRPPSALVSCSPAVDAAVLRCLEKEPRARFPSVEAVLAAFRDAVFGDESPRQARMAVGLLVHTAAADDEDDEALAEATLALDAAEQLLRERGHLIALLTSSEVLGVRVLPAAPAAELAERRAARDLAVELMAALAAQGGPAVHITATLHVDEIHLREGSGEVAGGPLLDVGAWSASPPGLTVTPRAASGLD